MPQTCVYKNNVLLIALANKAYREYLRFLFTWLPAASLAATSS